MKITVLFDAAGNVHAILHPPTDANAPHVQLHAGHGHRAEVLDVPDELAHLGPGELHKAVKVEVGHGGAAPRLVAHTKR